MARLTRLLVATALVALPFDAHTVAAQEHAHAGAGRAKLGTVHFPTSCAPPSRRASIARSRCCTRSSSARRFAAFNDVLAADSTCAMAHWGIALSAMGAIRWRPATARRRSSQQGRAAAERRATRLGAQRHGARARRTSTPSASSTTTTSTRDQRTRVVAYERAMADARRRAARRHRSEDLLRHRARRRRAADGQDVRESARGGRDPRGALGEAAESSGPRALHHPRLRRAGARAAGARGRAALRDDRAVGRARAAHAVAHLHARRHVEGVGRRRTCARSQAALARPRRSPRRCTRRTTRCTPTCRCGRTRAAKAMLDGLPGARRALRSQRDHRRGARLGRRVRARGDPGALRARAARRGREAAALDADVERLPVRRRDDLFRARARRVAHRRHRRARASRSTRSSAIQRAARGERRGLLGGAGRDPAARRAGVARARRASRQTTRSRRCARPPRARMRPRRAP